MGNRLLWAKYVKFTKKTTNFTISPICMVTKCIIMTIRKKSDKVAKGMNIYKDLKVREFGRSCRRCINKNFGISLKPEDCVYLPYMAVCHSCGELRNIVMQVRPQMRWKLCLFGKRETSE